MAAKETGPGTRVPGGLDAAAWEDRLPIAVMANSYRMVHANPDACGLRPSQLRCRAQSHGGLPRVGEEFLLNTRLSRADRETELSVPAYFDDPGTIMLSQLGAEGPAGNSPVGLPQGSPLRLALGEAIARRRSRRQFTGDKVRLRDLAALLRAGAAVTAVAQVNLRRGGQAGLRFRAAPSGGGLYPVEIFLAALQVSGLQQGIYRYRPVSDDLMPLGASSDCQAVVSSFAVTEDMISLSRAAVVVLLIGYPWRSMRKYGPRGVRYVLLEAGAIAQNLHLAGEAAGLASVACASVYDDEIHSALGLDGTYQTLLHAIVFGYGVD